MKPSQRLADVLLLVLIVLGVLNFFSPVIGVERDPLITYAFVAIAGIIFGFAHGGRRGPENSNDDRGQDGR